MKLKGIVKIVIADIEGNIKLEVIQENLIPDNSWLGILGNNAVTNYFGSRNISIATDNTTPSASVSVVTGVIGTCTPVAPSPVWTESIDPPYGTLTGRISPTGVSRVFNSVALTGLASANTQAVASTTAYARLLLDIPCTQGINDFVNITYTIQFIDNIGDGFTSQNLNRYDLGRALFNAGQYRIGRLDTSFCDAYFPSVDLPIASYPIGTSGTTDPTFWASSGINLTNFKWNYQVSKGRDIYLGAIIHAMTQGQSNTGNRAYALSKYIYDKEPFQTGFKKTNISNVPFFDTNNFGSSQGYARIEGTWTGKLPEFYKIQFTASGAVGVATYKFSMVKHTGFNGNTYTPLDNQTLYRTPSYQFVTGLHGWREEDFDVHRLSNTEVAQYDITGVSIVDIFSGENKTFDATTTPALTATQIRQIAVDATNRLIYIACRDTGLWIINLTANTITQQLNQPCYGVDVGRNNVAIAIVNGGLYRSTDWITPASFTFVGITDSNWNRVRFLKADPQNANDQIAIVADNGSGVNRIVWYQFSDNSSVLGYQNANVRSYPASLDVSDINSHWVLFQATTSNKITYGTATLGTSYTSPYYRSFTHSIYGALNFSKVSFYRDNYISRGSLVGGSDTATYDRFNFAGGTETSFVIHMDSGIVLASNSFSNLGGIANRVFGFVIQLLPTITEISYGWDGSNWVAGNTNSKTTHVAAEALINGLTIRFEDGATTPHFIANEVFTQSINYGLLKDNATSIEIRTAWYSKTMHNETIAPTVIAATVDLPAGLDPVFRRLDTDIYQGHRFYIDGVLATTVWLDGTAPMAGEVTIQASGSATLTFNTADIGKTLTGNYVWIET